MQVAAPVIILAFLVVAGTCAIMIPVMLWVFQLYDKGWNWQYAALFGSMLGATDAVAIIATMKSSKAFSPHTALVASGPNAQDSRQLRMRSEVLLLLAV